MQIIIESNLRQKIIYDFHRRYDTFIRNICNLENVHFKPFSLQSKTAGPWSVQLEFSGQLSKKNNPMFF